MQDVDKERFNIIIFDKYIVQEEVCSGVRMLGFVKVVSIGKRKTGV